MKDRASCGVFRAAIAAGLVALGFGSARAAYVPVEWIKADGKQWIYTACTPTCTDRVEMKVRFSTVTALQCLYCSRGTAGTKDTFTGFLQANSTIRFDRNTSTTVPSKNAVKPGVDYVIVADGNTRACTVNGSQEATMADGTFTPGSAFSLFASHLLGTALSDTTASSSMSGWGSYTLYYFRVYDKDGNLVRHFIPARDDSVSSGTAQYGLYETETKTFHPGLGSGSFTAGPNADGYHWNTEKECMEYRVSAQGADGVTVSLDGETYAESAASAWTEFGTPVTVTVLARPPQGCAVVWEGVPANAAAVKRTDSITLTLSDAATLRAVSRACKTLYWRGTTDALASKPANWVDGEDNPATSAPLNGDAVVFDAQSAAKAMTWDVDDVELSSWTQDAAYTGVVTFMTGLSRTMGGSAYKANGCLDEDGVTRVLKVTGDVTLNGGTWKHPQQPEKTLSTTEPAYLDAKGIYRLVARVGGNFTLGTAARIDVTQCGFCKGGPGDGGNSGSCGHGGGNGPYEQSSGPANVAGRCYGSTKAPVSLGSGRHKNVAGGGSVELKVTGALVHDGQILANGGDNHYAASGGSVYLIARSIAGGGSVSARGGQLSACYNPGGGGRVAVKLTGTGSDFSGFTGTLSAAGGKSDARCARAGTVYRETLADNGAGELIVTGNGNDNDKALYYSDWHATMLTDEDANHDYRRIVLSEGTMLGVATGAVLKVGSNLEIANPAYDRLCLFGGSLQVEDGYEFTNMQIRALRPSAGVAVVFGDDRHAGTTVLGEGCTLYADSLQTFDNLRIKSGGKITHIGGGNPYYARQSANGTSGAEVAVRGDMTIDEGGSVDVSGGGYYRYFGPAPGSGHSYGGSHGGHAYNSPSVICYGSITRPFTCGSGPGYDGRGGGRVKLFVDGDLTVNGTVDATALISTGWTGGGAGGSVWISARKILGSGEIKADGTHVVNSGNECGGGGRIAVTLTGANAVFADSAVKIHAYGGRKQSLTGEIRGGAGTVYLREKGEAEDEGTLVVENGDQKATITTPTPINTTITETRIGSLVVSNNAHFVVREDATLTVTRNIDTRSGFFSATAAENGLGAGHVELSPKPDAVTYRGTNEFQSVRLHAPGKTVCFGADSLFAVAAGGVLELSGEEENELTLVGADGNLKWPFKLASGSSATLEYLNVSDSDASSGMPAVANFSTDGGGNVNWSFPQIVKGQIITWTGEVSDEWADAGNWDLARLPVVFDTVVVSAGAKHGPKLPVAVEVDKIEIAAGMRLDLNGFDLTVNTVTNHGALIAKAHETVAVRGDFVNDGTFSPAFSTIRFVGTGDQTFAAGNLNCGTLAFAKDGGTVSVSGTVTADRLIAAVTAAHVLDFADGTSLTVRDLQLDGGDRLLSLVSADGAGWSIAVTGRSAVKGVTVKNCDASGGRKIYAGVTSQDGGGNTNWDFATEAVTWTGGATGKFSAAANWSGNAVPGANDRVLIDGAVTVTADEPVEVLELTVGGGDGAANLVSKAAVSVLGNAVVAANGTWTCDGGAAVANTLIVEAGGVLTHSAFPAWNGELTTTQGLRVSVDGDVIVEVGGSVDVSDKGWAKGPGYQSGKAYDGGTYGGRTYYQSGLVACYGSIVAPTLPGSGGNNTVAGGAVEITAGGMIVVDGLVRSNGKQGTDYAGSGGAIWLKCAQLSGEGTITAQGGNAINGSTSSTGSGGRIAIHQRTAVDDSAWLGTITAYGGYASTLNTAVPISAAGTVCWQNADSDDTGTRVIIDDGGSTFGNRSGKDVHGTDMPVTTAGDRASAYRTMEVVVRNGGMLELTGDLTLKDLELLSNGRLLLKGHTLTLLSRAHRRRKGWTGTVVEDGGTIRWASGLLLFVR